jgi:hypothetical protein
MTAPTAARVAREAYYHPHHADGDARWEAVASAVASPLAAALAKIEGRTDGYDPGTNEYDVHEIAAAALAFQPHVALGLADVTAERDRLRVLLARRGALIAEILGTFVPVELGMRARVPVVTHAGWKRDAGQGITGKERKMTGG